MEKASFSEAIATTMQQLQILLAEFEADIRTIPDLHNYDLSVDNVQANCESFGEKLRKRRESILRYAVEQASGDVKSSYQKLLDNMRTQRFFDKIARCFMHRASG